MFKKWFKRKPFVKITINEENVSFSTNITDIRAIWGLLHVTEEQLKKMNPKLADFIAEQEAAEWQVGECDVE